MYWALLAKCADGLTPGGQKYGPNAFHLYYRTRFLGADDIELPNGRPLTIPRSTADLDADQFSEYLDKVQADAAERGIFLED
jgi:hypothetical protein